MRKPYTLTLTQEDVDTIGWVGNRYEWSSALQSLVPGNNELSESEAWEIRDAFDRDTEGGHSMFPLLDADSSLAVTLATFYERVV